MTSISSEQERQHFVTHGWVKVDHLLGCTVLELQQAVDEVAALPEGGPWLHHREMTDSGPKLARTENFLPFSPLLNRVLADGAIARVAGELLGEPALIYKEKINYKLVGGAGFAPHQDQPAYPFVARVLSVMVAVDDATIANGCLEVVSGAHGELLPQDERGCIDFGVVSVLNFQPLELRAGETLFFSALTPHRSGPNLSERDRRALYPTYNGVSEGNLRDAYYAAKLEAFADPASGDLVRLSLIQDFEGRAV